MPETRLRFEVLGPLRVWRDGALVALGPAQQRRLLAALLVADGPVAPDTLIERLWPEAPPASALNVVQTYVTRLRKLLDPDRRPRAAGGVLVQQAGSYRLAVDPETLDHARLAALGAQAEHARRAGEVRQRHRLLAQAAALWRGPVVEDLGAEVRAWPPMVAIEQELVETALAYADTVLDLLDQPAEQAGERSNAVRGRPDEPAEPEPPELRELLPWLVRAAGWVPLHEPLHARLVLAYHRAGQRAAALDAYERIRTRLREQLGVDPGGELREAHLEVLRREAGPVRARGARPRWRGRRPLPGTPGGRESPLREITELLPARRLVTVTGPGGVGKTTLALAVAGQIMGSYADGVAVAELGPLPPSHAVTGTDSTAAVVDVVAQVLGFRLTAGTGAEAPLAALLRRLQDRDLLLLVDNAEHVAGPAGRLVDAVLRACPTVDLLVTSRRPLDVVGETVWQLPPLAERDAVRLFRQRAGEHYPDLDLLGADAEAAVARVCRRLDGLPLAIELAAARLRTIPLLSLPDQLELPLLRRDNDTELPHQHALATTIAWSISLLDDPQRRLLSRLAIFAGTVSVEAVEQVGGHGLSPGDGEDEDEVAATLAEYLTSALELMPEGGPEHGAWASRRMDVLLGLAAVALERCDPDGLERTRAVIEAARAIGTPEVMVPALAGSVTQLLYRGRCDEAEANLNEALARAGTVPSLRRLCLHRQMLLALPRGRYGEVDRLADELLSSSDWVNVPAFSHAAYLSGMALTLRGRHTTARRRLQDALDRETQEGRNSGTELLRFGLAFTEHRAGRTAEARRHLRAALYGCAEVHDHFVGLLSLQLAATIARQAHHPDTPRIATLARRCRALTGISPWPFNANGDASPATEDEDRDAAGLSDPSGDADRQGQILDAITTVAALL